MHRTVIVGVDGSPESADALRWALEQARLMQATLRVVYAWDPPNVVSLGVPPLMTDWEPLRERALEFPGDFVREVLGEVADVPVVPGMVRGRPAQVLCDASADADLLVLGSRGLGGLKGMVLGSCGHHCAAHAQCPVVIVHHAKGRRRVRRRTLHEDAAR